MSKVVLTTYVLAWSNQNWISVKLGSVLVKKYGQCKNLRSSLFTAPRGRVKKPWHIHKIQNKQIKSKATCNLFQNEAITILESTQQC